MAPLKSKALSVPQDRAQAGKAMAEFAAIDRSIEQLQILMNEQIAKIKQQFFDKALPLRIRADAIAASLQAFCEANRDELTGGRKTKTVDFGVGKAVWRSTLAKVNISAKDEADLITHLRNSPDPELQQFLRAAFELDRVMVLRHPDKVKELPGVEIAEAAETFEIKPAAEKIPEAALAEAAQ
jgi:phage host-nuclease inhibitor protein Gam